MSELEVEYNKAQSDIETTKFQKMVEALGQKTLISMANAGPE